MIHLDLLQERSRLNTELEGLRRRLHQAERELVETKEGCVELTNTNQALEREVSKPEQAQKIVKALKVLEK